MVVEILGAKMLAPYVGTSHFVWTAQIAVTLMALATGYYTGGRLADRSPRLSWLYWAILGAAVYLGFTVLVVEPVAYRCLDFNLAVGSLLASAFLFFVPLALLAMVGPFFVRMLTVSIESVGGNVGRLTAIGTLGSFVGTILIGYVFIPYLANSIIMYLTSGLLLVVAAGYFFTWGRKQAAPLLVLAVLAGGGGLGGLGVTQGPPAKGKGWHEVYRANSNYGRLQVIDNDGGKLRFFMNDYLPQNIYDIQAKRSALAYTYVLQGLAGTFHEGRMDQVLCIGLGVGIVPMKFARDGAQVDVVEINPAIVPVAERYFDLQPGRLNLTIDDGRHYLNRSPKKYDVVVLDAFLGDSSPTHLMSREAFAGIHRLLRPGGVLVINSLGDLRAGRDFFPASLARTLQVEFQQVRICASGNNGPGNVYFVAFDGPEPKSAAPFDWSEVDGRCLAQVQSVLADRSTVDPGAGLVLTDDYNPVEFYDAANRESVRRSLVANYAR